MASASFCLAVSPARYSFRRAASRTGSVSALLPLAPELRQFLRGLVSGGHGLGQADFLLRHQQGHFANFLQVHADRIVDGEAVDQRVGIHQLLFFHAGDFLGGGAFLRQFRQQVLLGADVDVQRLQGVVELVHLLALKVQVVHGLHELGGLQLAFFLALGQKLPELFVVNEPGGGGKGGHLLVVQPDDASFFGLLVGHDPGSLFHWGRRVLPGSGGG